MVEGGESSVGIGKEVRFLIFFLCLEDFASGNSSKEEKSREAN